MELFIVLWISICEAIWIVLIDFSTDCTTDYASIMFFNHILYYDLGCGMDYCGHTTINCNIEYVLVFALYGTMGYAIDCDMDNVMFCIIYCVRDVEVPIDWTFKCTMNYTVYCAIKYTLVQAMDYVIHSAMDSTMGCAINCTLDIEMCRARDCAI